MMRMKIVKGTRMAPAVMSRHPRRLRHAGKILIAILFEILLKALSGEIRKLRTPESPLLTRYDKNSAHYELE